MRESHQYQLDDRFLADHGTVFLTGIQALARLPIEQLRADRRAGRNTAAFVSGYPGSPLGGYDRTMAAAAALVAELPIVCRPGLNEELAASAVMGSQLAAAQPDCRYDGIVGVWYGKSPGVDRAADALRHAVYAGTSMHGGAVALVGDDPTAKSSTVPSSAAGLLADMHVPVLYPGDPAEALELGRHAITLSRTTGLWSALKIVADVADATASVELHPERFAPQIPELEDGPYTHAPDGRLLTPHTLELERDIVEVRYELATRYASMNRLNRTTVDPTDAWIGLVASGITYREVREALARLGLASDEAIAACGIRMIKMGMPLPFYPETMRRFARGLREVFVIEEKQPNMESLIKDALYALPERPAVVGKEDETGQPLLPGWGGLLADAIVPILRKRLERVLPAERLTPPTPAQGRDLLPLAVARTPFYCSGCPHNRSTQAPDGALVGAGIGCHTMALLMDPERVGNIAGVTCMGSEGAQWVGMSEFVERDHFVQNLGDGTFFHSGQLAVQASVAAGVNVTYKLLYNGTVAMTGGQDPEGQLGVPDVARILLEQGVTRVLITTDDTERYRGATLPEGVEVWGRERLLEAQEHLAAAPGVTVLIHDQRCAAEARRARKRGRVPTPPRRVVINHRLCEGCGDCGQVSNCLSVQPLDTPFGRKTRIDQTTCNLDYSCLEGDCPSFLTVTPAAPGALGRAAGWLRTRRDPDPVQRTTPPPPDDLPDPTHVVPVDEFAMRITGIGGTGVVTVAQVLGTAAMLGGYHVRGLDQIGLSQKAGPVVSDVRLSRSAPTATNRLGEAQADLLLAFDQLVAASAAGLLTANPRRTAVVGSTSGTPTGEMITHPRIGLPPAGDLATRIAAVTRPEAQHWADAAAITTDLFGSATTANLFVVGMAVQAGCLPIEAELLERAIGLNGVAVEANVAAFRWGRCAVADPARLELAHPTPAPVRRPAAPSLSDELAAKVEAAAVGDPALGATLTRFAGELIAWQNASVAGTYLDTVGRVAAAERKVDRESRRLAASVAAQLFRLLAYKDEYEVARLLTHPDAAEEAQNAVGGGRARVTWRLHPPLLRALGLRRKIGLGTWATPLVRMLARAKVLRGTPLDLFGYAAVRRVERALPGEYCAAIDELLDRLSPDTLDEAVRIAELPDHVRGYEELKLTRVAEYRAELRRALAEFDPGAP